MYRVKAFLFLLVLTTNVFSEPARLNVTGIVTDTAGSKLPFASLRVEGTSLGTMCDQNGKFSLPLTAGNYNVIVSYIGYQSKTVSITVSDTNQAIVVKLFPAEIRLSEVIVEGVNPAYPIIREAIERKKHWQKHITNFKVKTYTKDKFGSDTAIVLLSEAYSDIYWRQNDSLREIVTNRRQSGNFPEQVQFAKVDNFINFNDDNITFLNHTFVAPLAEDVFSYYDFSLQKTFSESGKKYFEIEIIPKTQLQPLFYGTIVIQDSSFALQKVTLHPNSSFKIPFFEIVNATISQQYSLYQNRFWFPLEYHIIGEGYPSIAAISSPKKTVYYSRSVICYEYDFNVNVSDSIVSLPSLTLLTKPVTTDSLHWETVKYFPLSHQEENAYVRIDSIAKSQKWSTTLANFLKEYQEGYKHIEFHYNRVEGLYVGVKASEKFYEQYRISAGAGIGIADKQAQYFLKPEILISNSIELWFGAKYYREVQTLPFNYSISKGLNFLSTLFNGKDYYDYYYTKGAKIFLLWEKYSLLNVALTAVFERHYSAKKNTDFTLNSFLAKKILPANPSINSGVLKSFVIELFSKQWQQTQLFEEPKNLWRVSIERSSSEWGSGFDFTSVYANTSFRIPTMGTTRLFNPYLSITASIGKSFGNAPLQKTFALESPLAGIVSSGTFRTVKNSEFSGDNLYALSVEHNFRNIPFIIWGIPKINFDIIVRAATGKAWIENKQLQGILHPTNNNYYEYTVGIGRIFDMFRIDFSYSDYSMPRYAISLMMGM